MAAVAQGGEPAARLAFELLEDASAREAMSARQCAALPADAAKKADPRRCFRMHARRPADQACDRRPVAVRGHAGTLTRGSGYL